MVTFFAMREPPVFSTHEAATFLGAKPRNVYPVLSKLVSRGWLARISRGLYEVAPAWASAEQPYVPDRYAALAALLSATPKSYVGYFSALELHGLLSQPPAGRLWVAVPRPRYPVRIAGNDVVWVTTDPRRFDWGLEKRWLGSRSFALSDLERTLLDGLHLTRHVGGISIIAGAIQRARSRIDPDRLLAHADAFGIEVVRRRLGYLLETLLPGSAVARRCRRALRPVGAVARAPLLDPGLPASGEIDRPWRLRINVPREDLLAEGAS